MISVKAESENEAVGVIELVGALDQRALQHDGEDADDDRRQQQRPPVIEAEII